MRSKVAKRIQNETPKEMRIFVRQYTDIVVRINEILKAKGFTQKEPSIKDLENILIFVKSDLST